MHFSPIAAATTSVQYLLPQYGLPKGLLPDAVKSYSLEEDGSFVIEHERPCYVHFENLACYEKKSSQVLGVPHLSPPNTATEPPLLKLPPWSLVNESPNIGPRNSALLCVHILKVPK
ncbi:hypothetical protein EJ110_NYTH57060 [Nymphaea thermarum]|nr:hypothetical protein EJ110_NYTH57060 [Nymphaea thermarum]